MDRGDVPSLLARLQSDEDAVRKMAVFKLQSSINDPAFADVFISSGGLAVLRRCIMTTGGNTLAYSLQSLSRLLEVDMGWEIFESSTAGELVERVVELIVTHPLVNILRGAMSILVAIVSHPQATRKVSGAQDSFNYGFRALKPAVAVYPQFFEMVVSQLGSADHALCANALMLLNALMRDSITYDNIQPEKTTGKVSGMAEEWPKFIKKLQDLGVITAVYRLMQGEALQDLANPLLDYQALTKVLLGKWRDTQVDLEKPEHRRALKSLHLASAPEKKEYGNGVTRAEELASEGSGRKGSRKHNPEKWRRLGFLTESPAYEFEPTGYLGMMDLMEYVRKMEDEFQKLLLEQSTKPMHERCPIAQASLAVTLILYEHFEVENSDVEDAKAYLVLDGMKNYDKIFKPLILQWPRLHIAGLHAFFRLWKATGAVQGEDFEKVAELVRILIDHVVGQATRQKEVAEVEEEIAEFEYTRLRELQMEMLEVTFEDKWGPHLQNIRQDLNQDAIQFVKEQRVRCLLEGAWLPRTQHDDTRNYQVENPWRFLKLSHNRRYLHYADFHNKTKQDPQLDELGEKIDLSTISSVVSNVSATQGQDDFSARSSSSTLKTLSHAKSTTLTSTKITINSFSAPDSRSHASGTKNEAVERPILTLFPTTQSEASEWLDGLLMLLNQKPITAETNKLIDLVKEYSMNIRLLNVRLDDEGFVEGRGVIPSREELNEDYFYDI
ncbi:ELMO/CED-12 family protein-like protein [Bisporella sp. PMI_857]|nr:ELMO/CED-12 family protein-like protein [Bisporella sp. PMI_857]